MPVARPSPLVIALAALIAPVPARAQTAPAPAAPERSAPAADPGAGTAVAAAIGAAFAGPLRLVGRLQRESGTDDAGMPEVVVMMPGGMTRGEPFHGGLEVLCQDGDVLVASAALVPGVAVLARGEKRIVQTTTDGSRTDVKTLARELPDLLSIARLRKAVVVAEWKTTNDERKRRVVAEAKLPGSLIEPDADGADEANGVPAMPFGKQVEHVLARVEMDDQKRLVGVRFTVVRFDAMHCVQRRLVQGALAGGMTEQCVDASALQIDDKDKAKEDMETDVYELTVTTAAATPRATKLLEDLRAARKDAVR